MTHELPRELITATRNPGKIVEIQELLRDLPLVLRSLLDFPQTTEVEETGATFKENAALKASAYALQTCGWTLSDDSGLEVEALGGAPGLYSARYAGHQATDAERIELLLSELSLTGDTLRRARFVCAVALSDPTGQIAHTSEGFCEGRIAESPRGTKGFGYDPLFIPDGFEQTFGELSSEVKGKISHRAHALSEMRAYLIELFHARG